MNAPGTPDKADRRRFPGQAGGIGHDLPQEAPRAFAPAILDAARE